MHQHTPTLKPSWKFYEAKEDVRCSVKNCSDKATHLACKQAGIIHLDYYLCGKHLQQLRDRRAVEAGPYLLFPREHREATQNAA